MKHELTQEQHDELDRICDWLAQMSQWERYWLLRIAFEHRGATERDPLSLEAK